MDYLSTKPSLTISISNTETHHIKIRILMDALRFWNIFIKFAERWSMIPILKNLYIQPETFLKNIKSVKIGSYNEQ